MKKRRYFPMMLLPAAGMALAGLFSFHGYDDAKPAAKPENAAVNYQKFCAGCHGEKLEKFAAKKWMDEKGNQSAALRRSGIQPSCGPG